LKKTKHEGDQSAEVWKENKEKSKSPNDNENEEEIYPEVKKSKDEDKPLGDHSAEVIDQMAMDDLESNEFVEKSQSSSVDLNKDEMSSEELEQSVEGVKFEKDKIVPFNELFEISKYSKFGNIISGKVFSKRFS